MKIGIIGIVNNLSTRLSSHNAGWTYASRSALETYFNQNVDILDNSTDYFDYDILVINEGVNYKEDVFNFFGGVQESQLSSLLRFSNFKNKVYSVNIPVDYNKLILKRKEFKNLNVSFCNIEVLDISNISNKLVLGDSHSISVYRKGYSISRNDGKTLHGFLKIGLNNFVKNGTESLIFYAGNIDIRFHVKRFGVYSIFEMLDELDKQLLSLKINDISVVSLLPIEDESRKLPGTGLYNGKPFYGSKEERMDYVTMFNLSLEKIAEKNGWNFLQWQFDYSNFSFDHMEAKQSVHLRPSSYMFKSEFIYGKDTNVLGLLF